MNKNNIIIIDGSSLMYRGFYALPLLQTKNGYFTNAITGFANMLIKIIKDYEPKKIFVAFDKSRKTFRSEIFKDYKGTREKTPHELKSQFPLLREFLNALGIDFIEKDNFEADDIIGSLAQNFSDKGISSIIVTGDKDALQLIDAETSILFTKKGINDTILYNENVFREKYSNLVPKKLIDLKALMGDKSDNIPGVAGIGEKTAIKLITEFDTLENLLDNIDKVKGEKLKEKLTLHKEDARLSYTLATINCEVDGLEEYTGDFVPDEEKVFSFCEKYEMKTLYNKIAQLFKFGKVNLEQKLELENETSSLHLVKLEEIKKIANKNKYISLHIETENHIPNLKIKKIYVCCDSSYYITENQEDIKDLLKDDKIRKYLIDVKKFYHIFDEFGGEIFDLMLLYYIEDSSNKNYSLKEIAGKNNIVLSKEELTNEIKIIEILSKFKNSAMTLKRSLEEKGILNIYFELEFPLAKVLWEMEKNGITVDVAKLDEINDNITKEIFEIEEEIYKDAGEKFNINSPKQLGEILFTKLNLPVITKTKTGFSTNQEVLESLFDKHIIIPKIINYRVLVKLKSTYLDGIKKLISNEDKKVYTTFNQTMTETGRLSSSEPNLQNIPVRTKQGRKIRSLFTPEAGYDFLLSADYSQIELRVMAHMAKDNHFIEAFTNNEDIHKKTAAEVFKVNIEEVDSQLRSKAKAVNFGVIYGISGFGLSKNLGISQNEAKEYIDAYLEECKGVKEFMKNAVDFAKEKGFVETLIGRRRYLLSINDKNFVRRSLAERMAINTPIQGTAADIIKIAMLKVFDKLKKGNFKSRMLLQVHDELLLEVKKEELDEIVNILKETMEKACELIVPLVVDCHYGKNWEEAK